METSLCTNERKYGSTDIKKGQSHKGQLIIFRKQNDSAENKTRAVI